MDYIDLGRRVKELRRKQNLTDCIPQDMTETARKQLAELLYQGY